MEKNLRKKVQKASQDGKTSRGLYKFKGFRHHSQFDIRVVRRTCKMYKKFLLNNNHSNRSFNVWASLQQPTKSEKKTFLKENIWRISCLPLINLRGENRKKSDSLFFVVGEGKSCVASNSLPPLNNTCLWEKPRLSISVDSSAKN